jgi:hypothetical protein
MKKGILFCMVWLLLSGNNLYAANGDLIVNGKLGVGTATPGAPLAIYSPTTFNPLTAGTGAQKLTFGDVYASNGWHAIGMCGGGWNPACLAAGGGNWFFGHQQDANTINTTAYITSTGNLWIAGALTQYSDVNLKTNIQSVPNILLKLKQTRAVSYQWKDPSRTQTRQLGVLAQELETVFPELVIDMPNPACMDKTRECAMPTMKTVDYVKLSAVALQGVKELSDKIDDLQSRIEKLEQLVAILTAK